MNEILRKHGWGSGVGFNRHKFKNEYSKTLVPKPKIRDLMEFSL